MIETRPDFQKQITDELYNHPDSVFFVLSDREKEILRPKLICNIYKKGEKIYNEGENPSGLICLVKGKVKVIKEGVVGREQIVRLAKEYGFIGYRAFFAREKTIASAVALDDDTCTCSVPYKEAYALIHTNPEFALGTIHSLAHDLGFADSRMVSLTQKYIRGRLAESLLVLYNNFGTESDNQTIKVYLSREDLAHFSNMTPSNAIRTLSTFTDEKVIALKKRKIRILDIEQLKKISRMG